MFAKDWSEIFEWRVDDDGVTITKFLQKNATSVDVPSEIDGKPVGGRGGEMLKALQDALVEDWLTMTNN